MNKFITYLLVVSGLSFSIGFLLARHKICVDKPHNNAIQMEEAAEQYLELAKLESKILLLLDSAKKFMASGEEFSVKLENICISGTLTTSIGNPNTSTNLLVYRLVVLNDQDAGLNGMLILRKIDSKHVDVLFRFGIPQLGASSIALCVDEYDIGNINWDSATSLLNQRIKRL